MNKRTHILRRDQVEIWKPVVGFEGLYEVSNLGNVRSLDSIRNRGGTKCKYKGKVLKQHIKNIGYKSLTISANGIYKKPLVHRLVAEAFIPNHENKPHVNHIDGDKTNNSVENLEWCSQLENNEHALKNGLKRVPLRIHKKQMIKDYIEGMSIKEISMKYRCCKNALSKMLLSNGVELRKGGYKSKRYNINKLKMIELFENNHKNRHIAAALGCPNTLIATYRQMWKRGELSI
jgi:hypothetical protein